MREEGGEGKERRPRGQAQGTAIASGAARERERHSRRPSLRDQGCVAMAETTVLYNQESPITSSPSLPLSFLAPSETSGPDSPSNARRQLSAER